MIIIYITQKKLSRYLPLRKKKLKNLSRVQTAKGEGDEGAY
jgi:hypothetical protein